MKPIWEQNMNQYSTDWSEIREIMIAIGFQIASDDSMRLRYSTM